MFLLFRFSFEGGRASPQGDTGIADFPGFKESVHQLSVRLRSNSVSRELKKNAERVTYAKADYAYHQAGQHDDPAVIKFSVFHLKTFNGQYNEFCPELPFKRLINQGPGVVVITTCTCLASWRIPFTV
jgi:hypothetical protein